ncbi:MAG: PAS domain S-box protein, partial [Methanoregula sp.]|nr:PAS domain S-box protein [Methanoregula sp.]
MACLGIYGRRFADRIPAAVPYMLIMFSAAVWAFVYAFEFLTDSLPQKIVFHNLRFLVLPYFSVLELWLVIAFVKKNEWLRKDWAALALIIPVAATILALTSPFHTLFRYNFSLNTSGPIPVLQYSESAFFTLYSFYSLILLVIAIIILIVESRKRGSLLTEQTLIFLVALAIPTVINYLFVFGVTPVAGVNMTAPLFWIAAILYTVALFRYRFLDIIPIARSRLIESMSTPMLVLDTGGRIIDLNPAACTLFSTSIRVAVGKPVNGIAPDWLDFLLLCESEETSRTDLVRGQGAGARFYEGSVELIRTSSGEPECRLVVLQDVTDRKRAEDSLRQEQQFSKLMLDSLPGIFYLYTYPENRMVRWNKQHETLLGYTAEEIKGKLGTDLHLPEYKDAVLKAIDEVMEKGQSSVESTLLTKDGHPIPFFFTGVRFEVQGQLYFMGIGIDITDRKRAEEALQRANKQLNLLSSITRHDILNQLMALKGYLYLSHEVIDNPTTLIEYIKKEEKAANTIEHQITFTKDYQDLGAAAPAWQNVNASINKAL